MRQSSRGCERDGVDGDSGGGGGRRFLLLLLLVMTMLW
jgi:hypothetical protein